jgi:uncharacterized protein YbbK (DUF523 family)
MKRTGEPILVSACLLGLLTRYDGQTKRNQTVIDYLEQNGLVTIPVCPEQLAGLPTPREATRFAVGDGQAVLDGQGQAVSLSGRNMNSIFCRGARETLKVARLSGCSKALLKERSPSCAVHQIDLNGQRVAGAGITTALLQSNGITVLSEEDIRSITL